MSENPTQEPLMKMDRRHALKGIVTIAGASIALPGLTSLAGCSSAPPTLQAHTELLTAIVDRIIPKTDTPGAVDAGVPQYIAEVFAQFFTQDQQSAFVDGLVDLDAAAQSELGQAFTSASAIQQDAALTAIDTASTNALGKAAWTQLRDMVIFGFYTSEAATQELSYEELPGRYNGCVPLSQVGNAWLERGV